MLKIIRSKYFLPGVLMFLFSSCAAALAGCISEPVIGPISDVKIDNAVEKDTLVITAALSMTNPNSFEFNLLKTAFMVKCSDTGVGRIEFPDTVLLKKGENQVEGIKIKLGKEKLPFLLNHSAGTDSVMLVLSGKTTAKWWIVKKEVTIEKQYALKTGSLLNSFVENKSSGYVKVKDARLHSLSLTDSEFLVDLEVTNPTPFPIKVVQFPADIYINNRLSGKGDLSEPITADTGSAGSPGQFSAKMNNFSSAVSALSGLFGGKMEYTLKGTIVVEVLGTKMSLPYQYSGVIIKI